MPKFLNKNSDTNTDINTDTNTNINPQDFRKLRDEVTKEIEGVGTATLPSSFDFTKKPSEKPESYLPPALTLPPGIRDYTITDENINEIIHKFGRITNITEKIDPQTKQNDLLVEITFDLINVVLAEEIKKFFYSQDLLKEIKEKRPYDIGFIKLTVVIQVRQPEKPSDLPKEIEQFFEVISKFYDEKKKEYIRQYNTVVDSFNARIDANIINNDNAKMNFRLNINRNINKIIKCIEIAQQENKNKINELINSISRYRENYLNYIKERKKREGKPDIFISLSHLKFLEDILALPKVNNLNTILKTYLTALYLLCLGDTTIMIEHIKSLNMPESRRNTIIELLQTDKFSKIKFPIISNKKNKFKKISENIVSDKEEKVSEKMLDVLKTTDSPPPPEKDSQHMLNILNGFRENGGIATFFEKTSSPGDKKSTRDQDKKIIRKVEVTNQVFPSGVMEYIGGDNPKIILPAGADVELYLERSIKNQIRTYENENNLLEQTKGILEEILKTNNSFEKGGKSGLNEEPKKLEKLTDLIKELYQILLLYYNPDRRRIFIPKNLTATEENGKVPYRLNLTYQVGESSKIYIYILCLYIFESFAAMLAYVTDQDINTVLQQITGRKIVVTSQKIKLMLKIAEKLDNMEQYKFADIFMKKINNLLF